MLFLITFNLIMFFFIFLFLWTPREQYRIIKVYLKTYLFYFKEISYRTHTESIFISLFYKLGNWDFNKIKYLVQGFIVDKNHFISKSMLFILQDTVSLLKLLDLGFEARKEVRVLVWVTAVTGIFNWNRKWAVLFLFCTCGTGMDNHLSFGLVAFEVRGKDVW